jgi:hypothetical protein
MQNRQCPHCGALIPVGDRFCGYCGQAIDAPEASAPAPAAPPTPAPAAAPPPVTPAYAPPRPVVPEAAPATPGRDTLAILSAIVGGLGLCAAWFPICGPVVPLIGLALGAFSLNSRQRTLALVGIGLGVLGLVITVISLVSGFYSSFWTSFTTGFMQGYSSGK